MQVLRPLPQYTQRSPLRCELGPSPDSPSSQRLLVRDGLLLLLLEMLEDAPAEPLLAVDYRHAAPYRHARLNRPGKLKLIALDERDELIAILNEARRSVSDSDAVL
jgi:hypothetical protein